MPMDVAAGASRPATDGIAARADRTRSGLLEAIAAGPLVLDAAMGTRLIARGLDIRRDDACFWNLDRPADVLDLHDRDARAGARGLLTNTFGASRERLRTFGRVRGADALNRDAVALARRAAGPSGFVLGDIGPTACDEPGAARQQAAALIGCGVDGLILETLQFDTAIRALAELRHRLGTSPVPVIVSLWRWPEPAWDAARRLACCGADVLGANCRPALGALPRLFRDLAAGFEGPLLAKPGVDPADPPADATPAAFAAAVPGLLELGVGMIGGCCGTTEDHVAAIAAACAVHRDRYVPRFRGALT
jgi:5-methyltetrahydrofolate--homocysteine methyltransferase